MKIKKYENAISEILGTILLLGIAVMVLTAVFFQVLSKPAPTEKINVDIVCKSEENCIILEHRWGSELNLNTEVSITIENNTNTVCVGDYLDDLSKENGLWNLGERMIYPLQSETVYVDKKTHASVIAVNNEYNSLIMSGTIDIDVVCDLGLVLTVDEAPTSLGETLFFNLTLTNHGNINIQGVKIEFLLPEQLIHITNITTNGTYINSSGIWDVIDVLGPGNSAVLTVVAVVAQLESVEPTQLALVMDGSDTTVQSDWTMALNEIAQCIKNQSTFPQNDAIEFTFVQFGGNPGFARSEINPTVINSTNYITVADNLINITQMGGRTPTSCGILLTADLLANSVFFDSSKRQIVLFFSNGNPLDCCNIDGDYNIDTCAVANGPKESSFIARDYLVNLLGMNTSQDQFNAISVGHSSPKFNKWLKNTVWPGEGYYAPPFLDDVNQGWVCHVEDWGEFVDLIDDIFGHSFSEIPVYVEISSVDFTDPKLANNFCTILLY